MLLSWLSKLVSALLVSILFGIIILAVFAQTIFTSRYLEGKLADTHAYSRISVALSNDLVNQDGNAADRTTASQVRSIITPEVVKQKVNGALEQFEAYNLHNGAVPKIDLTDLAGEARAAGLDVSADSNLSKPITFDSAAKMQRISSDLKLAGYSTLAAAAVLLILLVIICRRRRKYAALPGVLISLGVLTGLMAVFFIFVPNAAAHFIKFGSGDVNSFVAIARDLATDISHDLGKRFGVVAGILLVVGISLRIWLGRAAKQAPAAEQEIESRTSETDAPATSLTGNVPIQSASEAVPGTRLPQVPTAAVAKRSPRKIQG